MLLPLSARSGLGRWIGRETNSARGSSTDLVEKSIGRRRARGRDDAPRRTVAYEGPSVEVERRSPSTSGAAAISAWKCSRRQGATGPMTGGHRSSRPLDAALSRLPDQCRLGVAGCDSRRPVCPRERLRRASFAVSSARSSPTTARHLADRVAALSPKHATAGTRSTASTRCAATSRRFEELSHLLAKFPELAPLHRRRACPSWTGTHGRGYTLERMVDRSTIVVALSLNKASGGRARSLFLGGAQRARAPRGWPDVFSAESVLTARRRRRLGAPAPVARVRGAAGAPLERIRRVHDLAEQLDIPLASNDLTPIAFSPRGARGHPVPRARDAPPPRLTCTRPLSGPEQVRTPPDGVAAQYRPRGRGRDGRFFRGEGSPPGAAEGRESGVVPCPSLPCVRSTPHFSLARSCQAEQKYPLQ